MRENRRTLLAGPANEGQVRRAQVGIVAAYIHQLSQRHRDPRAPRLDAEASTGAREGG
jgi:hypothetical protein